MARSAPAPSTASAIGQRGSPILGAREGAGLAGTDGLGEVIDHRANLCIHISRQVAASS
jgi:hypothetical protein